MKKFIHFLSISFLLWGFVSCKEAYLPPVVAAANNFLVVDGMIRANGDSTYIKLTRTRNLSDTTKEIPETGAQVSIVGTSSGTFVLSELGKGQYAAAPLNLDPRQTYRLKIQTKSGGLYLSDAVPVKITPPIDSVSWVRDSGLHIRVSTHDPLGETRYYRWQFSETWEYYSFFESILGFDPSTNNLFFIKPEDSKHHCWTTLTSSAILLNTTKNLSEDKVENFEIHQIPKSSDKVGEQYSIIVYQYALTKEAFEYWQLLKKNSTDLGSIFGTQPTEVISNIKCISNPNEPVIGFMSISALQQKRIFIKRAELSAWNPISPYKDVCKEIYTIVDSIGYYMGRNNSLVPAYNITGGGVTLANKICVDCTLKGGNTIKPSFWP